jgi:hypothetical protein
VQFGDGGVESLAVGLEIETHCGGGDHLHVEIGESKIGSSADTFEASTHDVKRVLGGVEQHAAGA